MKAVPASLALVDGAETITIRPTRATAGDPIICRSWDLGAPDVRSAAADRTNQDGVIDTAGFTGARTVTLELVILGDLNNSPYHYAERLAAMTHPYRRPKLRITRNSPEATGQTWEMVLRGNPYSLSYGRTAAAMLEMQLSFSAPTGYLEGDYQGYTSALASVQPSTGITFPITFPLDTGTAIASNPLLTLTVGGSAPVSPLMFIYGPSVAPKLVCETGEQFSMPGLNLLSGQIVQIDMAAGTVLLDGSPTASLFSTVDWTVSTFWRWFPGVHVVNYVASTGRMGVFWRDRRFTI